MFRKLNLHARIGLLVATSLVPLAATGLVASFFLYRTYSQANSERLLTIARTMLNAAESKLDSVQAAGEVLALSANIEAGKLDAFHAEAQSYLSRHLPDSTVVLTDRSGAQQVNTARSYGESLPATVRTEQVRRGHEAVFKYGKSRVSDLYEGPVLKSPRVSVHIPVLRRDAVEYILGVTVAPRMLANVLTDADLPKEWTVAIFDRSGATVARQPFRGIGESASPSLLPALEERRDQVLRTTTHEGTIVTTAVAYSPRTGWSVAMGAPQSATEAPFRNAVLAIFAMGAMSLLVGILASMRLARSLLITDRHRDLLINELNHRVKNTLAIVQALVTQTLRHTPAEQNAKAIEARLFALSRTHNLLTEQHWDRTGIKAIVEAAVRPYMTGENSIEWSGPNVSTHSETALMLALMLNELATNATKYGSLGAGGKVRIRWTISGSEVQLVWAEEGGPPVQRPDRQGFGTRFIERASGRLRTQLRFESKGLQCLIQFDAA